MADTPRPLRCAVYTRKSSEEGLDQAFNSLHAQREACEAYILSQKHEGWSLVSTAYDDGGFSGGSMVRPALQALLADIAAGLVDIVVVYKVDRLTRSLADFAKIVEALDAKKASFVSVTQAFNTTTSMGRLTLNVLLSFAQFEREVTGERIRDKIAASKAKGMWMGGVVPLGYDVKDRTLVPNPTEAEQVRTLFTRYLALQSADALVAEADRRGIRSKRHLESTGIHRGGGRLSRGSLYRILSNPLYAGEIAHRGQRYAGQHEAIIERALWDQVQVQLEDNRRKPRGRTEGAVRHLLMGLVQTGDGAKLASTHSSRGTRRYLYYVGGGLRIPAGALEYLVLGLLRDRLGTPAKLASALVATDEVTPSRLDKGCVLAGQFAQNDGAKVAAALAQHIQRILVAEDQIKVHLMPSALGTVQSVVLSVSATLGRRKRRLALLVPGNTISAPDNALIAIVAQARRWFAALASGEAASIDDLAARDGVGATYISSLLPAAFLAPAIVEKIAAGRQDPSLSGSSLRTMLPLPSQWEAQRVLITNRRSI